MTKRHRFGRETLERLTERQKKKNRQTDTKSRRRKRVTGALGGTEDRGGGQGGKTKGRIGGGKKNFYKQVFRGELEKVSEGKVATSKKQGDRVR